jgi:hypothetical protein
MLEVQSRIAALYEDTFLVTRMPNSVLGGCEPIVANAAVYGGEEMFPAVANVL